MRVRTSVKIAVSLVGLGLAYRLADAEQLKDMLQGASYGWLAVGVLTSLLGNLFGTLSWNRVINSRASDIPLRDVFISYWTGLFFNTFLPSTIGGDVAKGLRIVSNHRRPLYFVLTIIIDRIINLTVLVLIGLVTVFAVMRHYTVAGTILVTAAMAACLMIYSGRRITISLVRFIRSRHVFRLKAIRLLVVMCMTLTQVITRQPSSTVRIAGWAFCSQFCKIWLHYYIITAMALDIEPLWLFFIIPLFGIVSALPISIGGIGSRELFGVWLAARLGLDLTAVACLSLTGHAVVVTANAFGGLAILTTNRKPDTNRHRMAS